ncbi:protein KTI12 homolog isoform X2 [Argonauta hians]
MPLVILCGLPCSGKSTVSQSLASSFRESSKDVNIVSNHSIGLDRNSVFADSKKEKEVRALLKSAVQRSISKESVTILDGLNYIKGFRYELYCVAKSSSTPHCVVYCATNLQQCKEWNKGREETEQYLEDIMEQLAQRFEMPSSQSRWDSPLFIIQHGDEIPTQKIADAIFHRKAPPTNMSTQSQPLSSTNFLYDLDCVTNSTIKTIMQAQSSSIPGDQLTIPGVEEKIVFNRHLPLSELQRYRRQFITYTKMHPVEDTNRLSSMFVSYLNTYIS